MLNDEDCHPYPPSLLILESAQKCRECNAVINTEEFRHDDSLCRSCDRTHEVEWDLRDDSGEDWLSLD